MVLYTNALESCLLVARNIEQLLYIAVRVRNVRWYPLFGVISASKIVATT